MLPTKEEILPPSCMDLVNPSVYEPNHDTDTDFIKHFFFLFIGYIIKCSFWHKGRDKKEFPGTGETDSVGGAEIRL